MKVAVTGATGVLGRAAVASAVGAGHEVRGLARTAGEAQRLEAWGATPVCADVVDRDSLVAAFDGCDAVCSLAPEAPVGAGVARGRAWRDHDRVRARAAVAVADAARAAGVRRLVQESTSLLYADHGEEWVTEQSLLDITAATEPATVAEAHAQGFGAACRGGERSAVILRFGQVLGDDLASLCMVRSARRGRPVGFGRPEGWAHVVHTDDLGGAVLAALRAPAGIYNVGAQPVRRAEIAAAVGAAIERPAPELHGPLRTRLAGSRAESWGRSLRVSSDEVEVRTGWSPMRPVLGADWFEVPCTGPSALVR
ncbi:MAG: NAD-dependent epimerase/dehydratase family protein [Nocardioides sp.]|nr:NAD-dependent epimerase/dehydratase family protein [Nocardioides sp.]